MSESIPIVFTGIQAFKYQHYKVVLLVFGFDKGICLYEFWRLHFVYLPHHYGLGYRCHEKGLGACRLQNIGYLSLVDNQMIDRSNQLIRDNWRVVPVLVEN